MEDIRPTPDSTKSKGRNRNRKTALRHVTSDIPLQPLPPTPSAIKTTDLSMDLQETVKLNSDAIKSMADTMGNISSKIEMLMLTLSTLRSSPIPAGEPMGNTSTDDEQVHFANMGFTPRELAHKMGIARVKSGDS